jgi:hypothetical protein
MNHKDSPPRILSEMKPNTAVEWSAISLRSREVQVLKLGPHRGYTSEDFRGFRQYLQTNAETVSQIRPGTPPSASFPTKFSLKFMLFYITYLSC